MHSAYVDAMMQNYAFVNDVSSSSSDDDFYEYYSFKEQKKNKPKHKYLKANSQRGGVDDNNENDRPTGGFPNIVLCSDNDISQETKDNNIARREIAADKAILSISQILKSRRNI